MNITENLQRILLAKQNIAAAITEKGVECSADELIDTYAEKILEISGGGGELPEIHDDDPLTFVQVRPDYNGSIALVNNTTAPNAKTFEYNKNDTGWQTYNVGDEISMKYTDKVQFRSNDTLPISYINFRQFITNGIFNCGGDIRSLYPGDLAYNYSLYKLFENTNILTAPKLPYTVLKFACYSYMFSGCNLLNTLPENMFPASEIKESNVYQYMFLNCMGLTTLPENLLPATKVYNYAYQYMFYNCKNLKNVPKLPATTIQGSCYTYMFSGCTSLTTIPENFLPATTLASSCYAYMFSGCTSLTTIPENMLPATTLASSCYSMMFYKCTGLTTIPENLLPATTLANGCYNSMFRDCSNLTNAPKLPAEKIIYSYDYMFYGCSKLKEIYCNARYEFSGSEITTSISSNWLQSVPNTTDCIFHKNPEWSGPTSRSTSTIPSNWLIVDWIQ